MNSNSCVIPECYVDSCLIEVLLFAGRDHVNHQKGNGNVANEMIGKFGDDFCMGVIDEDREPIDYLSSFLAILESKYLRLWKHETKNHYIIQIRPVIEKWIIGLCSENGIKLKDFGLPEKWIDLAKISKSVTSKQDQRFIGLFKEMKELNIGPVMQLRHWIIYLKENKYNADINQLKNG
jgi:hypothetical protein